MVSGPSPPSSHASTAAPRAKLIFDQGLGHLLDRIAGNVINTDILGSMEFACNVSGSKLLVVLCHTSCGAVKGAVTHVEMGILRQLLGASSRLSTRQLPSS